MGRRNGISTGSYRESHGRPIRVVSGTLAGGAHMRNLPSVSLALLGLVACSKNQPAEEGAPEELGSVRVEITGPDEGTHFYDGDEISLSIQVDDTYDRFDDLDIRWSSDIDGHIALSMSHQGGGVFEGETSLSVGDHALTVIVRDSDDNASEDGTRVDVGPENSPPICAIVFPTADAVGTPGELTVLTAEISDPDVDANLLRAEWASTLQGPLGNSAVSSDGTSVLPVDTLEAGTHTIQLVARDERGAG